MGEAFGEDEKGGVAKLNRNRGRKDYISSSDVVGSNAADQKEDGGLSECRRL